MLNICVRSAVVECYNLSTCGVKWQAFNAKRGTSDVYSTVGSLRVQCWCRGCKLQNHVPRGTSYSLLQTLLL